MRRSILLSIVLSLAGALPAGAARADEAADTATARALGIEGVILAEAGKCREAVDKLKRAEQLHHAPTTATRLGECEIEIGRVVVGTERLQRVVREPLAPNAHPAFAAAVARAQRSLDKALPRIAAVRIEVKAPRDAKLALSIDGEPVPEAAIGTDRPIDPGGHEIAVSAPGYIAAVTRTSLAEGETRTVALELRPAPRASGAPLAGEGASGSGIDAEGSSGSKVPAIVAFGLGAAGAGVGIFAAINVATKSSALERSCDANRVCPPERDEDLAAAKTWATVSTAGFITAGVGLAAGTLILLATGKKASPSVGLDRFSLGGVF